MQAVKQQKGLEVFQLHTHLAGFATGALALVQPIFLAFLLHFGLLASAGKGRSGVLVTELLARTLIFLLLLQNT